jgi:hypothetical protein
MMSVDQWSSSAGTVAKPAAPRRARWMVGAVVLGAVVAAAVVVPLVMQRRSAPAGHATVVAMPRGPLSARRDVSAVWTGTELVIWGGMSRLGHFADGAAYDPATQVWRPIAGGPLSPRAGAPSVWTGTEMIVWSGEGTAPGPQGLVDGAAYDPRTDRWRRIADAPGEGRSGATTRMVAGRMVTAAGSSSQGVSASTTTYVYAPATDRWTSVPTARRVADVVASGDTLILAEMDDSRHVHVEQVGLDGAVLTSGDTSLFADPVEQLGLAVSGSTAYLVVTDERGGTSTVLSTRIDGDRINGDWSAMTASEVVGPPVQMTTGYHGLAVSLSESALLLVDMPQVAVLDPRTGRVQRNTDTMPHCGASGALAWTGTQLLSWGGQTCRAGGPELTGDGIVWTPSP